MLLCRSSNNIFKSSLRFGGICWRQLNNFKFIKKNQQDATMYQNFIIPYLYDALHVQQPFVYEKPEAASAVLGS
jgi:hypothetical protein